MVDDQSLAPVAIDHFPPLGATMAEVEAMLDALRAQDPDVRRGRFGMFSLRGNADIQDVAHRGYERFFSYNGLFARMLPSIGLMQQELLSGWASLLSTTPECGVLTSGGTDSLFNAVHSIREWAREHRPGVEPEIIAPFSAHASFTKSCHYLGVRLVRVPLDGEYRVDLEAMEAAITDNTVGLIASAPAWPHGVYDPIGKVAALARKRDLWLHVDACVGGCLTPFVRELGYAVPEFAFEHEGVCSVSLDLHKYGYAPKPCSALFYADEERRRYQGFATEEWSNGPYKTDAFVGSRPGGAVAGAWAVMRFLGHEGYLRTAERTMSVRDQILAAIEQIPELHSVGSELSLVTIGSAELDIKVVGQGLASRGWSLFGVRHPELLHLTCDAVDDELVAEFIADLVDVTRRVSAGELNERGDLRYT